MPVVTLAQIAEWRRALHEEGDGEFLDPTLAQVIAPKLMEEVERLHDEIVVLRREIDAQTRARVPA